MAAKGKGVKGPIFGSKTGGGSFATQTQTGKGKASVPTMNKQTPNTKADNFGMFGGTGSLGGGLPAATPPHASHAEKHSNRYAK